MRPAALLLEPSHLVKPFRRSREAPFVLKTSSLLAEAPASRLLESRSRVMRT